MNSSDTDSRVATDDELKLLAVRKTRPDEHWLVEKRDGRNRSTAVGFTHDGKRSQLQLTDRTVRVDGKLAAVSYPRASIVEVGAWSDSARSKLDAELPWLPHRSNTELGRMFSVTLLAEDATSVQLELAVPDGDTGRIQATFSKQSGRLLEWNVWMLDRIVLSLTIADDGKAAVAKDADGNVLERWTLAKSDKRTVPQLLAGSDNQLVVITESARAAGMEQNESAATTAYREAVDALSRDDRKSAATSLRRGLKSSPGQPMLQFLLASCFKREDEVPPVTAEDAKAALEIVAKSGASSFLNEFKSHTFEFLTPASRLELLSLQPESGRTSADWLRLAEAAFDTNKFQQAFENVKQAKQAPGARDGFDLEFVELGALLGLERQDTAKTLAQRMAEQALPLEQQLQLANRMARGGWKSMADSLLKDATTATTSEANRQRVVHHRSALHSGLDRWRIMLSEAARASRIETVHSDVKPGNVTSPVERSRMWLTTVLSELRTADSAGRLAEEFKAESFAIELLIREADLAGPLQAAEKAWALWTDRRLPRRRLEWLVEILTRAQHHRRVVSVVEGELRRSHNVSSLLLDWLEPAYRGLNRPADALRASSHQNDLNSRYAQRRN